MKKLDKSEKSIFIIFIILFVLDILSTIFFIMKGKGLEEANLIIWKFGWVIGGIIHVLGYFIFTWIVLRAMQGYRNNPSFRFHWLSSVGLLLSFKLIATISNIYYGLQPITEEIVKPTAQQLGNFWINIAVNLLVLFIIFNVTFWIYMRNYKIEYIK